MSCAPVRIMSSSMPAPRSKKRPSPQQVMAFVVSQGSRRFTSPLLVETATNRRANSNSNATAPTGVQRTARHDGVHNRLHGNSTVHVQVDCVNTYRFFGGTL